MPLLITIAIPISINSATVCHSLVTREMITAYSFGMISPSPSKMIPSLTPRPDGVNTARIPMIQESPSIPATLRNRNRINRAYQHVEPDTDNQPVADEQQYHFDHLRVGDRD